MISLSSRNWYRFTLLLIGFLIGSFVIKYFISIEKETLFSRGRFVGILETTIPKEKETLFKLYDGVETFVMFIGYPRSSHSLLAAILDAHPEIIIPNEYDVIEHWEKYRSSRLTEKNMQKYVLFDDLHQHSMKQAMFGIRAGNNTSLTTGYHYNIPGLWQGGYQRRIKVIGDKKGDKTALDLTSSMRVLEEINQVAQVPMKFIHVTRNPFDNISTMMLLATESRDTVREEGVKINKSTELERAIKNYFQMAASNQRVRERYGDAVIDIPGHETVIRPKETLQRLCDHLGVTCSEDYFEKCSRILYGAPSVARDKVVWTEEQKARVTKMTKNYTFLKDYSFDEYPN
ncbi:hypothetical protein OS493_037528 [Desmophyllum pertusum]|uniref:Protein-tyrosine sulfotransferase n=1 Tax=Desmophyllum pertusum TaxID=174260 RepID=A0A9W9ZIG2_9CNID|nr:hypothetical protein OS493_037528 [Desmophyllum pertusum]